VLSRHAEWQYVFDEMGSGGRSGAWDWMDDLAVMGEG
jgi:hypothetical protein